MEQMQHCISLHSAFHADLRDNFEKRFLLSVVAINGTAWAVQTPVNEKFNRNYCTDETKNIYLGRKFSDFHAPSCHDFSGFFDVELNLCFTKANILHFEFFVLLFKTCCLKVKKKVMMDWLEREIFKSRDAS